MTKVISLYCDGSSTGKTDGPTGWAWVLVLDGVVFDWEYGGSLTGSNNTAELAAAVNGLRRVSTSQIPELVSQGKMKLELVCDSQYVLNMACRVFEPTKHFEVIEELIRLKESCQASTRWVRGHNGDVFNEKCDRLAKIGREMYGKSKEDGETFKTYGVIQGIRSTVKD